MFCWWDIIYRLSLLGSEVQGYFLNYAVHSPKTKCPHQATYFQSGCFFSLTLALCPMVGCPSAWKGPVHDLLLEKSQWRTLTLSSD